jgi:hypothetical protein
MQRVACRPQRGLGEGRGRGTESGPAPVALAGDGQQLGFEAVVIAFVTNETIVPAIPRMAFEKFVPSVVNVDERPDIAVDAQLWRLEITVLSPSTVAATAVLIALDAADIARFTQSLTALSVELHHAEREAAVVSIQC